MGMARVERDEQRKQLQWSHGSEAVETAGREST